MHVVTGSYFRSRKKDGGDDIRSAVGVAVGKNHMLHAHNRCVCYRGRVIGDGIFILRASGFIPTRRHPLRVYLFWTFSVLWPWPWPDDLHMRTWPLLPVYTPDVQTRTSYAKTFESYRLIDRQSETDRQIRSQLQTKPLHGWSVIITSLANPRFESLMALSLQCQKINLRGGQRSWILPDCKE